MKDTNTTISVKEILESDNRFNDGLNEQILAAMLLLSSLENELGRLNRIEDDALALEDSTLQAKYDAEFAKFNVKISFNKHTVELGLQSMDVYSALLTFLLAAIDDADINRT